MIMNDDDNYLTQFIRSNRELAQTDDDTLAIVLHHLANAAPGHPPTVQYEEIKKLDMLDLRPLLASGRYADVAQSVLERISSSFSFKGQATPAVSDGNAVLSASIDNKTSTILEYQSISDQKQEAIQKLVKAGLKEDFASEVVEDSGTKPNEIIKDPARVLGEYWYTNLKEAVDFLDDGVAVSAEELKRGLTALHFQDSVVDSVYRERTPRPDMLAHRDIFSWGEKLVKIRLLHNS